MRSKTITIFLPTGNPSGVKEVELSNRTLTAVLIPRALLKDVRDIPVLEYPSLYILCERHGEQIYIGEAENFLQRSSHHIAHKDFWDTVVIFATQNNSLEKGDIKYLESLAIERGHEAKRYQLLNKTIPKRNTLHKFKQSTIEELFEDIRLLIAALGYPIFEPTTREDTPPETVFSLSLRGSNAQGIYDENGFTILKGSLLPRESSPSFKRNILQQEKREHILHTRGTPQDAHHVLLTENVTCSSPSAAASLVIGNATNGWISWKNNQGQTLDDVYRRE